MIQGLTLKHTREIISWFNGRQMASGDEVPSIIEAMMILRPHLQLESKQLYRALWLTKEEIKQVKGKDCTIKVSKGDRTLSSWTDEKEFAQSWAQGQHPANQGYQSVVIGALIPKE